jgi:threonine synthase
MKLIEEAAQAYQFPLTENSLWRYADLLPVGSPSNITSLGEGWTPLLFANRLGKHLGLQNLRIKDEARNPTLSFKDRGMSVAISKHLELGSIRFALPSAGNAAVSVCAYSAAANAKADIFLPKDTPRAFFEGCKMYGGRIHEVNGTISDCGEAMARAGGHWTNLSTTKEPFRVEGKKTLAFEIAEQLDWNMPDVIICPTGGGTAMLGIWKGIEELKQIGLIEHKTPRMYAAQSEGCAPIVKAYEKNSGNIEPWTDAETSAFGLRVPSPFADRLIMKIINESKGGAVAVAEAEIKPMMKLIPRIEGIDVCPESAVGFSGLRNLVESNIVDYDEEVVVLNTGSGMRYT